MAATGSETGEHLLAFHFRGDRLGKLADWELRALCFTCFGNL